MVTRGLYADLRYILASYVLLHKQDVDYTKFLKFVKMDSAPRTTSHISTRRKAPAP